MSAHSHYHKDVRHLDSIDVYRVLDLFKVTDPCVQHAVKKLLVMGGRGAGKDADKDLQEAIDSLLRAQAMRKEDGSKTPYAPVALLDIFTVVCPSGRDYKVMERRHGNGSVSANCATFENGLTSASFDVVLHKGAMTAVAGAWFQDDLDYIVKVLKDRGA
ncbi:hypothetical protein [Stenotrophomonas phage vB_SmaS_BUCT548]|uniref:Uncharacterized protein n=1 Tax=Stenotrophomonas phage vB_SmaS_BUCT548 TaxID=2712941 RepID=A0A7D2HG46_9CAUD|nr:hypothetical protein PQD75_gp042 [Stenotrophomonas phage vB_SmaS_BUCT548]QIQ60830.1 hypothetical protein [Stenotrophomonas phage vB_SmaS_BUCT548]WFG37907.1 hypothetical protein 20Sep420_00022 [Pseudomonas phage 20Sep420]